MKKVLSVLLAFVMVAAMAVPAFAAEGTPSLTAGETEVIVLEKGETAEFAFKSISTGIYRLTIEIVGDGAVYSTVYFDDEIVAETSAYYASGLGELDYGKEISNTTFLGKIGQSFTIELAEASEDYLLSAITQTESVTVKVTVTNIGARRMIYGNSYEVADSYEEFYYTPIVSEYYNFRSTSLYPEADPYVDVFDCYGEWICGNDDNGYDGDLNFDLTVYLYAGETYRIVCGNWNTDEVKPFSLTVSNGSDIKVENFSLDTDFILATIGETYGVWINVVPTGAVFYPEDYTITVSNDDMVTVCLFAMNGGSTYFEFIVTDVGETTVTITNNVTGQSDDVTIKAVPAFLYNLFDFFYRVVDFFTNFFSIFG